MDFYVGEGVGGILSRRWTSSMLHLSVVHEPNIFAHVGHLLTLVDAVLSPLGQALPHFCFCFMQCLEPTHTDTRY